MIFDRHSKIKFYYLEEQTEEPILFQKPVVREELLGIVCRRPYSLNFLDVKDWVELSN